MGTRLIERYLPVAEIGIESVRERTPMTPFPAPNRLHVWWARRPLVASRAAVLASLLPENADREAFKHALGIHGDPVASRRRIDVARQKGVRFEGEAYSYPRAFAFSPSSKDIHSLLGEGAQLCVLDPTAGGGAIPLEAFRLGLNAISNDLNPVASLLQKATIEYPSRFGNALNRAFRSLIPQYVSIRNDKIKAFFPREPDPAAVATNYLWARTITCPYCTGSIPLSPNWRLTPSGKGTRLKPQVGLGPGDSSRVCGFEIVDSVNEQSPGTVAGGDALCPFPDCGRAIGAEEIKRQAIGEGMGEQIFAIVNKRRTITKTKAGKNRVRWDRGYRAPSPADNVDRHVADYVASSLPQWEAMDFVPTESIPEGSKTDEARRFGILKWRDMFSPRQLVTHCAGVEAFRTMLEREQNAGSLTPIQSAAYVYLAIAIDKMLNYNSRMSVWMPTREVTANTFNRHDFAFCWSHVEMSLLTEEISEDWACDATAKALEELVQFASGARGDMLDAIQDDRGRISIINGQGASMPQVADKSVDAIIMDPPYGANVMYAELSDFFYVWLKRTAGLVVPELFTRRLADKESEALRTKHILKDLKARTN